MLKTEDIIAYLELEDMSCKYSGDMKMEVRGYSRIEDIKENTIIWIKNKEKLDGIDIGKIKNILIVTDIMDVEKNKNNIICSGNSKEVFFSILDHFFSEKKKNAFISPKATVETNDIGEGVYIGHNCYIGPFVQISDNVTIMHNVVIEGAVKIGSGSKIFSGVVIGADGYGFFKNKEGMNTRVPHFGGVTIGKNVEIGANTCIDRGTLGDTKIGDNVKIDNLCHVAHNVEMEENVSLIALSMIAGSVKLKKNAYIAPSASIINQTQIGENSIVGLGAVVIENVEENTVVAGVPAKCIRKLSNYNE